MAGEWYPNPYPCLCPRCPRCGGMVAQPFPYWIGPIWIQPDTQTMPAVPNIGPPYIPNVIWYK